MTLSHLQELQEFRMWLRRCRHLGGSLQMSLQEKSKPCLGSSNLSTTLRTLIVLILLLIFLPYQDAKLPKIKKGPEPYVGVSALQDPDFIRVGDVKVEVEESITLP